MSLRRIAFAASLALSLAACATAPATKPSPPSSSTPSRSVGPGAIEAAQVRDAARRLGGVREAFRACVEAAAGTAATTQACIQAEMQYQQGRLDTALATRRAKPGSGDVDTAQARWLVERDRLCGSIAAGVADAPRIQAGICRLEATAARADALAR